MIAALYILLALVVVGTILYLHHRFDLAKNSPAETTDDVAPTDEKTDEEEEECCGMHITCERDSLLASVSPDIVYYDDEELDRFRGTPSSDYSDEAIEEFRNVLFTLLPEDIAGWARSIQLRGIELPDSVREELLMIIAEARAAKTHN